MEDIREWVRYRQQQVEIGGGAVESGTATLACFSDSIGDLTCLNLEGNKLTSLPESIGNLTHI